MTKGIGEQGFSRFGHSSSHGCVLSHSNHGRCQTFHVAVLDDQPGDAVSTNFRGSVDIETDHRSSGNQSLRENSRKPFPVARMDDSIGGDGEVFDLVTKRTTTFGSYAMTVCESSPSREVSNPKWTRQSPHEAPPCEGILKLYNRGNELAAKRGLILVDTKYEFGKHNGTIYLIDEVHTPDSSRYFYKEGYEERQQKGEAQKQLSKEFVRQWLIENGFQGKEGQQVPEMTEAIVKSISERYQELYRQMTGESLTQVNYADITERIEQSIVNSIN